MKDCSLAIRGKSGKVTDVLYNATVYRDEMEKVQGVFVVARDVTEQKLMEQRLRELRRLADIGETAAWVGHDLRNPLQVIVNRLYLAKKATDSLQHPYSELAQKLELRGLFDELNDQVLYMDKIVSDLQDYARDLEAKLVEVSLSRLMD